MVVYGVIETGAALRWLAHHFAPKEHGGTVILSTSSKKQLDNALEVEIDRFPTTSSQRWTEDES